MPRAESKTSRDVIDWRRRRQAYRMANYEFITLLTLHSTLSGRGPVPAPIPCLRAMSFHLPTHPTTHNPTPAASCSSLRTPWESTCTLLLVYSRLRRLLIQSFTLDVVDGVVDVALSVLFRLPFCRSWFPPGFVYRAWQDAEWGGGGVVTTMTARRFDKI